MCARARCPLRCTLFSSSVVNVTKKLTVASDAALYFQLYGNVRALIYRCQECLHTHTSRRRPHSAPCPLSSARWALSSTSQPTINQRRASQTDIDGRKEQSSFFCPSDGRPLISAISSHSWGHALCRTNANTESPQRFAASQALSLKRRWQIQTWRDVNMLWICANFIGVLNSKTFN